MSHISVININKVQLSHVVCKAAIKSQFKTISNLVETRTKPTHPTASKLQTSKLINAERTEIKSLNELTSSLFLFSDQLVELQPMLLRMAKKWIRNDAWAEDAVSETFLAAIEKPKAFAGYSTLRTWLIGILKHKLVDQIRLQTRECQITAFDEEADTDSSTVSENINDEHLGWGDPEEMLIQQQFISKVDACLKKLPKKHAQVFKLKYGMEMESNEICHHLGLTHSNLHVMLHRSRAVMRASLI